MTDPRICVVGAGNLASRRIYPHIGAGGGQLAGVCDLDVAKAERNARRFGGHVYDDVETMLDTEKPDGVVICIGPEQHAELAPVALRRGIPVYTEKPPAASAAAALEVTRIAKEANTLCATGFKRRYNLAYNRAKEWIEGFPPNDHYALSVDFASGRYPNDAEARSLLLDFAIHAIDLVGYLFGDAAEVFAFAKGANAYAVSLRFASGAVGSLSFNDGRSFNLPTEEVEISMRGGNFMTIHNSSVWRIAEQERSAEWREPPTFTSSGDSGNETGHLAEIVDFISAIREGRKNSRSSIYESYKSMVLYEAIKESAETARVVPVRYEPL